MLIPWGFLSASFQPAYYAAMSVYGGQVKDIAIDSNSDIVISTWGFNDNAIMKVSKFGEIIWQKEYNFTRSTNKIAVDSSNNIYVFSQASPNTNTLTKLDSTGSVVWNKSISATSNALRFNDMVASPSGNVYLAGNYIVSSVTSGAILKLDSSGASVWQRQVSQFSGGMDGIELDSSENVFVTGTQAGKTLLSKFNSSGTVQWTRSVEIAGTNNFGIAVKANASNVYVASYADSSPAASILTKYNTSGTLQWSRQIVSSNNDVKGLALDSSENIYLLEQSSDSGSTIEWAFSKWNSSGTVQWQRKLGASETDAPGAIAIDDSGDLLVGGGFRLGGSDRQAWVNLPSDGTKTGTFTVGGLSVTYAASSQTTSTVTPTSATVTTSPTSTSIVTIGTDASTISTATFTTDITEIQ